MGRIPYSVEGATEKKLSELEAKAMRAFFDKEF